MHGLLGLILAMQTSLRDNDDEPSAGRFLCSCGRGKCAMHSGNVNHRFDQRKGALLEAISCGVDKSKKGSFDAPIADMLEHINEHPAYVTTSSCSGRIALFLESGDENGQRGKGGEWLLCQHSEVDFDAVMAGLTKASESSGFLYFKHEPFIMHVQCRSLDDACKLLEVAKVAGYRESGISPGKKNTMLGIRTSSLKIDVPVMKNGVMMVSPEYVAELVKLANEKFVKNRKRTDELYNLLKTDLLRAVQYPPTKADGVELRQTPVDTKCDSLKNLSSDIAADGVRLWSILCHGSSCEQFRARLVHNGWLDRSRRNVKMEDGRVSVPVTEAGACALRQEDAGELGMALRAKEIELHSQTQGIPSGKGTSLSPHASLRKALSELLLLHKAVPAGQEEEALREAPRHWEEYGDLVLLPEASFASQPWAALPPTALWECVARGLGVRRVALKAEVDAGPMRQSRVSLVHPVAGADGWVKVTQNGIVYTWDVTRVMFSRGNVNERRRMGEVCREGEDVVDLYAGIGYFTIPMLTVGRAARAWACEWNPDSVEALRRNLALNGVADRCQVLAGDNSGEATAAAVRGKADRVSLGLLPSSEAAWPLGLAALKPQGGWLHVHANVAEAEQAQWTLRLQEELERLAVEGGRAGWACAVRHVQRVKTYAPHVWHLVADVECRPRIPTQD